MKQAISRPASHDSDGGRAPYALQHIGFAAEGLNAALRQHKQHVDRGEHIRPMRDDDGHARTLTDAQDRPRQRLLSLGIEV